MTTSSKTSLGPADDPNGGDGGHRGTAAAVNTGFFCDDLRSGKLRLWRHEADAADGDRNRVATVGTAGAADAAEEEDVADTDGGETCELVHE